MSDIGFAGVIAAADKGLNPFCLHYTVNLNLNLKLKLVYTINVCSCLGVICFVFVEIIDNSTKFLT